MPADAENYRVRTIAEGKRTQTVEVARAEAERIRKIGAAEATAIEVVGKAEAEKMLMKAQVYKQYGDAAIMQIVLESLPKVRIYFIMFSTFSKKNILFIFRLLPRFLHRWPRPRRSF